jgi:hypothetical protein
MSKKIKNTLLKTLVEDQNNELLSNLITYNKDDKKLLVKSQILYNQLINYRNEKFSEEFISLSYKTLESWNMNQRGARLSSLDAFQKSIIENRNRIIFLKKYKIETIDTSDFEFLKKELEYLFINLKLVEEGKPKLVTFSKTLHFFLPNLLMPIDRSYTLKFFYESTDIPNHNNDDQQFEMYFDILLDFNQFVITNNFESYKDDIFHRNIPKIIDNIIIKYVNINEKMKESIKKMNIHFKKGETDEAIKIIQEGTKEFWFMVRPTPNLDKRMLAEEGGSELLSEVISKTKGDSK